MDSDIGAATLRKVGWRVIPFAMLLFVINYLDRVNIGFAALQMNKDLGFSPAVYGLGAGIFFIGYFLFEVPSNLILHRVGARRWLARIMVTWGVISTGMAWVNGETAFYAMRFLLGVAEAGFFPGIILYFSYWFPARERAKAIAIFMTATAISNIIGAPLSTALLSLDGVAGLRGWQAMLVLEGLPAIVIGFAVLAYLTDRPEAATWLSAEEKQWLVASLEAERSAKERQKPMTALLGLSDPRVLAISALCFCLVSGNFGVVFWLPQIIKAFGGLSNLEVGGLTAVPYLLAVVAMIWWGRRSDRTGERKWHLAGAALAGAVGLAASAAAPNAALSFAALCLAAVGIWSMFGVFWALPGDFLSGSAAASGFALINSIGALGGFAGPSLVGFVRERSGTFSAALLVLAGFVLGAAIISALLPKARLQTS